MKIYTQIIEAQTLEGQLVNDVKAETISLNFDERKRGRFKIITDSGMAAGIQIERGHVLRDGSVLSDLEGNQLIIAAAAEKVSTAYEAETRLFARACYHLGNRHVPLQVGEGFLRYQQDYVLDDMLRGLGLDVMQESASFEPENGAYAPASGKAHQHAHN